MLMDLDRRLRRISLALLAMCLAVGSGLSAGGWAAEDVRDVRAEAAARQPGYLRDRAVADQFWDAQAMPVREVASR